MDQRDDANAGSSPAPSPAGAHAIDPDGLLYTEACGGWRVDLGQGRARADRLGRDVADWMRRAREGSGQAGQYDSRTAYFWGQSSWGGPIDGACTVAQPQPVVHQAAPKAKPHGHEKKHPPHKKPPPKKKPPHKKPPHH